MYSFRLRFDLREEDRIGVDSEVVEILARDGITWTLKSAKSGAPISAHPSASILAKDFPTEEAARNAGRSCRHAILAWAVSQRRGVDLGHDAAKVVATTDLLTKIEAEQGVPARNDIHGLDVFPSASKTAFVRIDARAGVSKDGEVFVAELGEILQSPPKVNRKVSLAAELFTLSYLDNAPRSRFIMLVSSVEALLEYKPHDPAIQEFVDATQLELSKLPIAEDVRASLKGALQWLRQESIGRAGRRLAKELLGSETYAQQTPEDFFNDCYQVRSQLVHKGETKLRSAELGERCDWLAVFVGDLLNQRMFGRMNRPSQIISGFERYDDGSVRWRTLQ